MRVGEKIKAARKVAGYKTQGEFAKKLGVSQKQVSRYERATNIEWESLERIADALNVPVDRLLKIDISIGFLGGPKSKLRLVGESLRDWYLHDKPKEEEREKIKGEILERVRANSFPKHPLSNGLEDLEESRENVIDMFLNSLNHWSPGYPGTYLESVYALTQAYLSAIEQWKKISKKSKRELTEDILTSAAFIKWRIDQEGTPPEITASRIASRLHGESPETLRIFGQILSRLDRARGSDLRLIDEVLARILREENESPPANNHRRVDEK